MTTSNFRPTSRRVGLALTALMTLGLLITLADWRLQLLLLLGMGLGATLNFFVFGFSSAWRRCILQQRTAGIRAQIIMLALALVLFSPLLWLGSLGEQSFQGIVRPAGLSVMLGAFLFGIGMQLAANCSSGTLNRIGQLEPLSFISFVMLFVGGVIGAYWYDSWSYWPAINSFSFTQHFGWVGLGLSLVVLGLIYRWMTRCEQQHCQNLEPIFSRDKHQAWWSSAQWSPLLKAGVLLALLNFAILMMSGQPWSLASVFTLWSLKLSDSLALGLDWQFWQIAGLYQQRMAQNLLTDAVSLTTIGVILGSLWVTLFAPRTKTPIKRNIKQAGLYAIGGFLMGFGATLSYGCNVGAFFSGIASGSLHGWLWIVFAVFGNIIALKWFMRTKG
ncbi:MAG: YeeE/YedE family protein [Thiomicrospira sp.]